ERIASCPPFELAARRRFGLASGLRHERCPSYSALPTKRERAAPRPSSATAARLKPAYSTRPATAPHALLRRRLSAWQIMHFERRGGRQCSELHDARRNLGLGGELDQQTLIAAQIDVAVNPFAVAVAEGGDQHPSRKPAGAELDRGRLV